MGYITQAGVGLGLAKEVANEFPLLGNDFATLMVAVIVISQLTGPPFFKFAIRLVGESHLPKDIADDEILDVVIVGIESQSRQLLSGCWRMAGVSSWWMWTRAMSRRRRRAMACGMNIGCRKFRPRRSARSSSPKRSGGNFAAR